MKASENRWKLIIAALNDEVTCRYDRLKTSTSAHSDRFPRSLSQGCMSTKISPSSFWGGETTETWTTECCFSSPPIWIQIQHQREKKKPQAWCRSRAGAGAAGSATCKSGLSELKPLFYTHPARELGMNMYAGEAQVITYEESHHA